tara:strand:- start:198 stop:326 length:129 start_codon:yes stop_codon:yes gene_type:complete
MVLHNNRCGYKRLMQYVACIEAIRHERVLKRNGCRLSAAAAG